MQADVESNYFSHRVVTGINSVEVVRQTSTTYHSPVSFTLGNSDAYANQWIARIRYLASFDF